MKILMGLQASYKTTDDSNKLKEREKWIVSGLSSLSHIDKFMSKSDCYYMDNTINDENELPKTILSNIPECADRIFDTNPNQYGKINTGAGNIEMLLHQKERIKNYDWYVHHEPRTVLKSGKFFNSFLDNPRNLFRVGSPNNRNENSVWTGTYFIKTETLMSLIDCINLQEMCDYSINIESLIKGFLDLTKTDYDDIYDADISWHDKAIGVVIDV
jgi:hypothetical protein